MPVCRFCGTKNLRTIKYKCVGYNFGRKVNKTVNMCICCDANTDKEWLAEQLEWDEVTEMINQKETE